MRASMDECGPIFTWMQCDRVRYWFRWNNWKCNWWWSTARACRLCVQTHRHTQRDQPLGCATVSKSVCMHLQRPIAWNVFEWEIVKHTRCHHFQWMLFNLWQPHEEKKKKKFDGASNCWRRSHHATIFTICAFAISVTICRKATISVHKFHLERKERHKISRK